jgi:transposase-like protein
MARICKRLLILEIVPNDEKQIEKYCKQRALLNMSETIYLYLNNTIEVVSEILEIDRTTVLRRVNRFLETAER